MLVRKPRKSGLIYKLWDVLDSKDHFDCVSFSRIPRILNGLGIVCVGDVVWNDIVLACLVGSSFLLQLCSSF